MRKEPSVRPVRERALRGGEQLLVVRAVDEGAHVAAKRPLLARMLAREEEIHLALRAVFVETQLLLGQLPGRADLLCPNLDAPCVIERLKGHKRGKQVLRAAHHAVVFEQYRALSLAEFLRDAHRRAAPTPAPRTSPCRPRPKISFAPGTRFTMGILRASEKATSVGGCACKIALRSGRVS